MRVIAAVIFLANGVFGYSLIQRYGWMAFFLFMVFDLVGIIAQGLWREGGPA